jgi:hypothetical protein
MRAAFRLLNAAKAATMPPPGATATAPKQNPFQRVWNSPVGMKTVHFWAPVMKWSIVIAGIGDFARPAEKLSLTQNIALLCTGVIWTRWCLIIKPKNYFLGAVNFFLGIVGAIQCTRIALYNQKVKNSPILQEVENAKDKVEGAVGT